MQTKIFTQKEMEDSVIQNAYSMIVGNIVLMRKDNIPKTIAITSCNPNEGKSSVSTLFAITMAEMNKKTLLVDLDLRKKQIKNRSIQPNLYGVAQFIKGDMELEEITCKSNIDNLFFIDTGKVYGNPLSLLCSDRMITFINEVKKEYDCIVFNTPSMECNSDALIISSISDATILIAKLGSTKLTSIKKVEEQLKRTDSNLIGIVLNKTGKSIFRKRFTSFDYYTKKGIVDNA